MFSGHRECQVADWPSHKKVCKQLKLSHDVQVAAAATAAAAK
jgi:hypothetical protein